MYAAVVGEKFTENVLLEGVTYIFIFYYTWLLLGLVYEPHRIMREICCFCIALVNAWVYHYILPQLVDNHLLIRSICIHQKILPILFIGLLIKRPDHCLKYIVTKYDIL